MSNHKTIFYGTKSTQDNQLEVFRNFTNEISICISVDATSYPSVITLDKATAIKLSRVLKSEISKIQ